MRQFYGLSILVVAILVISQFDVIIIFLLSGFIPGANITLAPSTMLAIMTAIVLMIPLLKRRRTIYRLILELYDATTDKGHAESNQKSQLPRRRFEQV